MFVEEADVESRIMQRTSYMGIPTLKMATDAWVYQEIIFRLRPEVIVEVGNFSGGSLLYLSHLCELVGGGEVVGVDIDHSRLHGRVQDDQRISLVTGDAIDVFPSVEAYIGRRAALVIEDSSHTFENTLAVMRSYGSLVKSGGYMIVEDGVMSPVANAISQFLYEQNDFVADHSVEWPLTWNPSGYLRRVR